MKIYELNSTGSAVMCRAVQTLRSGKSQTNGRVGTQRTHRPCTHCNSLFWGKVSKFWKLAVRLPTLLARLIQSRMRLSLPLLCKNSKVKSNFSRLSFQGSSTKKVWSHGDSWTANQRQSQKTKQAGSLNTKSIVMCLSLCNHGLKKLCSQVTMMIQSFHN